MNKIEVISDMFDDGIKIGDIAICEFGHSYIVTTNGTGFALTSIERGDRFTYVGNSLNDILSLVRDHDMSVYRDSEIKITLGKQVKID